MSDSLSEPASAAEKPKEEYERIEFMHAYKAEWRDRGAGRPTKKERRMIEKMKDDQ